jgi:hypothetical protein
MLKGLLTEREKEVLRTLLSQRGITRYSLFDVCAEGTSLPGSTYPLEIESMSGKVITSKEVYSFWLDWIDDHYTLGEEDGFWKRCNVEELYDGTQIRQIQQQLQAGKED